MKPDMFYNKFSVPWNQSTPVGYVEEMCFSIPISFGYFFVSGTFSLLFISICVHHQAFYEMFKLSVNKLKRSNVRRCDAKFLRDSIRFHILVKE